MRIVAGLSVALALTLGCAARGYGQIAADPLIQVGSLNLQTGAYSPLADQSLRLYALGLSGSANETFTATGHTESDAVNGERVGADYDFHDVTLSLGYQEVLTKSKSTDPSIALGLSSTSHDTQDTTFLAASVRNGRTVGEVRVLVISEQTSANLAFNSLGSFSGSLSQSYVDVVLGMSADVTEHIRAGFNVSPEVHSTASYGGTLGQQFQATRSIGHGTELRSGVAYNLPWFTLALDAFQNMEDDGANFAAVQGALLHTGILIAGTVLLVAEYEQDYQSSLVETGQSTTTYVSPAIDSNTATLGLFLSLGSWVVGAECQQQEQQVSSSYGNVAADADRIKSGTSQLLIGSILKVF